MSALVVFLTYFSLNLLKLFPCAVAQSLEVSLRMFSSYMLNNILARVAAVVVRRAGKLMLHARVEEHQFVANRLEGEIFELAAAAVETHEATLLTEYTCELVHDTAVYTTVVVLCSLTSKSHIPLTYLVIAEEIVDSKSEAALKSS